MSGMQNDGAKPETKTVGELLDGNDNRVYRIPIYQRPYAWGEREIETLLDDVRAAKERVEDEDRLQYCIGTLVTHRSAGTGGETLEIVDGQQRLITLFIIAAFYRNRIDENKFKELENCVEFECRPSAKNALNDLCAYFDCARSTDANEYDKAARGIYRGSRVVSDWFESELEFRGDGSGKAEAKDLLDAFFSHVFVLVDPLPETNLNHYFEIMNTRGVQLEPTEIVKANLMGLLDGKEDGEEDEDEVARLQSVFAMIWSACSDMSRHVQMGFRDTEIRKAIFGDNGQRLPSGDFDKIAVAIVPDKGRSASTTIEEALGADVVPESDKTKDEDSEQFGSVLDFPNFLLVALSLFYKGRPEPEVPIRLDDRTLLDAFKNAESWDPQTAKQFACFLLKLRMLFDACIVKSDLRPQSKGGEGDAHWSLGMIGNGWKPVKSFCSTDNSDDIREEEDSESQGKEARLHRQIRMLESMFQVTFPRNRNKRYVYFILRWMLEYEHDAEDGDLLSKINRSNAEDFRNRLVKLACKFLQKRIGDRVIPDEPGSEGFDDPLNQGVGTYHLVFNSIDYLVWFYGGESKEDDAGLEGFEEIEAAVRELNPGLVQPGNYVFRYRNSVEHFSPQRPRTDEDDGFVPLTHETLLDDIGNLCLMSRIENSARSNLKPVAKIKEFPSLSQSLKFQIMAKITDDNKKEWTEKEVREHSERIRKVVNAIMRLELDEDYLKEPQFDGA